MSARDNSEIVAGPAVVTPQIEPELEEVPAQQDGAPAAVGPEEGGPGARAAGGPAGPWVPRRQGEARWLPRVATAAAIAGVVAITLWQLHPSLLLSGSSTTGGDTGAHYMMPAFFNSNLFPHLTGWDPAWYAGYPIYTFYFVLPDVLVAIASHVITYNVAFKLATVAGSVLLPVAAWACGRLFGLRRPIPAALAAATLPFLFDYSYTIYGGNLFSTLAGEYSFSFALVLALVFLGLFARGLRTGRHRAWTAVVLAACVVAHIVPTMFALAGAVLLTAFELVPERFRLYDDELHSSSAIARPPGREGVRATRQTIWWALSTVGCGLALSAWWLVPFGLRQAYSTSMGYDNVTTYATLLLPVADRWALLMAAAAVVVALVRRSRFGVLFSLLGAISALALDLDPQGHLYNVRLLPLWFLCVFLMAGWLFGVVVAWLAQVLHRARLAHWSSLVRPVPPDRPVLEGETPPRPRRSPRRPRGPRWEPGAVAGPLLAILGAALVVVPPFVSFAAADLPQFGIHPGANQVSAWATWNYTGYEGKSGYPEYHGLMATMRKVGADHGCGRAMWEYNANENRFGTPEALMLLPYWTGGCIDSMEGLLFESSTTTPFHFLNQAELSPVPSNPMVGLPYGALDVPLGIEHLQLLGVRYFMAASTQVQQAADADPALRLVASSGPWRSEYAGQELATTWRIYEVKDSSLVTPLAEEPAVLSGVGPGQSSWLGQVGPDGQPINGPSVAWYLDPSAWRTELTAGGPSSWPRVGPASWHTAPAVPEPKTTVSDVRTTADSVRFRVSRLGVPVLVKVSYFPNWQAQGADGPWRATPNLMVVVPTSHEVVLTYGSTHANDLGLVLSILGALGLVALWGVPRFRRRRVAARGGRERPGGAQVG